MADRLSAFSDPEVIALLRRSFVPAAQNDWYARRRSDAVGEFFKSVADQGPRRGEDGSTRQGIYAFTASGKLLAFSNHRDPERRKDLLRRALGEWDKLPESDRAPGAVSVPALDAEELDARYHDTPPENGIVLRTFTRTLERTGASESAGGGGNSLALGACEIDPADPYAGHHSAFDHVWIREAEWRELIEKGGGATPESPAAVPSALAARILRFHLVDNTRGEPPMWKLDEIRTRQLVIYPLPSSSDGVESFRIDGRAVLATDSDLASAERGFIAGLRGAVDFDRSEDRIIRFDAVALGDHWGEGGFTGGARPGRAPLGIAFELADGSMAGDNVRPQASTWLDSYYRADQDL